MLQPIVDSLAGRYYMPRVQDREEFISFLIALVIVLLLVLIVVGIYRLVCKLSNRDRDGRRDDDDKGDKS